MITRLGVWQAWCLLVKEPSCKSCTHSSRLPEEQPPSIPIKYSMSNLQKHYLSNFLVHLDIQLLFSDWQYWFFGGFRSHHLAKATIAELVTVPVWHPALTQWCQYQTSFCYKTILSIWLDTLDIGEIIWNLLSYLRLIKCWSDHLAGVKSFQTSAATRLNRKSVEPSP